MIFPPSIMDTVMTHLYSFRMLEDPNPKDKRPFASKARCSTTMARTLVDRWPNDPDIQYEFLNHMKICLPMEDEEIVRFHHIRRELACCSRIKWELVK